VDEHQTGELNKQEFIIAMYFIDHMMKKRFSNLPEKIPSWLSEQAMNPSTRDEVIHGEMKRRHHHHQSDEKGKVDAHSHGTRHRSEASGGDEAGPKWVVTRALRKNTLSVFEDLDKKSRGYIKEETFLEFMEKSKLPKDVVEAIW
jgi:hypothetical protein